MTGKAAVRLLLFGFVALSAGIAVYKASSSSAGLKEPASAAAAQPPAREPAAAPARPRKKAAESRKAVVYYFYTNTRCSSCQTIEAYTREAVAARLAAGYKGWKIEFRGVNVDEAANGHFVQDYWLNSKAVIVQKFAGDKTLNWGKLDKVWTLIGDKEKFMDYVASETRRLLDAG
ncbi:MAG TPA: hypothetical protein DCS63_02685 [Elusimicrobia bacterium]|nr:hypothetical protein [Elusimicrobiota bacterium]